MSREDKIMSLAIEQALLSTQTFRHGAVITGKGGKIFCKGYNKGNRTKILNNIFTCTHAEMDVVNKLINGILYPKYGKNYKKHCKKYSIWVTRIDNNTSLPNSIKKTDSKPCFYCGNLIKKLGFNKVHYSIHGNKTISCKISALDFSHKSECQEKAELNQNLRLKNLCKL